MNQLTPRTREAVLQIAAWQIGVLENPAGSNKVKYAQDYGLNGQPWCVMFVWWCFREAGFNLYKTASCTAMSSRYKAAGQWVTSGFKPGDIVMFDFSGRKSKTEHCGIVESVDKDGNLITIEGNTGTTNDSNGGEVMRRIRSNNIIVGACRPAYIVEQEEDKMDIEHLTDAQLVRLAEKMQVALAKRPISNTLAPELAEAVALGITDGSNPNAFCTRAQAAVIAKRAANK